MAWLEGCRHGMSHRLSAWCGVYDVCWHGLVYCAVILLDAACCAVLWCGLCWCAVSSSGSAVPFCGWACRVMPFSGWLCRSWQLCHGLAYSGLAHAFVVGCVGILCPGCAVLLLGVAYFGVLCRVLA